MASWANWPGHTLDDKLQNFILFSSVAASRGSSHQAGHLELKEAHGDCFNMKSKLGVCVCVYIFLPPQAYKRWQRSFICTVKFTRMCIVNYWSYDIYICIFTKQYNLCISSTMRPCKYCLILSGSRMNLLERTQNKAIQRTTILYWHAQKISTLPLTCDCLRSWHPMGPMAFWVPSFSWCFASGQHSKYSWSLEYEETTYFPVLAVSC